MDIYRSKKAGGLAVVLILALLGSACGHSPSVKYYSLRPAPAAPVGDALDIALAIGPAQFPRALARSQIVTRTSGSRVDISEYHVWSAPLEYEFLRILGENIARQTGSDHIAVYPKEAAFELDYRVTLDVLQFDGIPAKSVSLRVRWTITPPTGHAVAVGRFEKVQTANSTEDEYDALVAAHSALIGDLATTIVGKLRELKGTDT